MKIDWREHRKEGSKKWRKNDWLTKKQVWVNRASWLTDELTFKPYPWSPDEILRLSQWDLRWLWSHQAEWLCLSDSEGVHWVWLVSRPSLILLRKTGRGCQWLIQNVGDKYGGVWWRDCKHAIILKRDVIIILSILSIAVLKTRAKLFVRVCNDGQTGGGRWARSQDSHILVQNVNI